MSEEIKKGEKAFEFNGVCYVAMARPAYGADLKCLYCALHGVCPGNDGIDPDGHARVQGVLFPSCMPACRSDACHVVYVVDPAATDELHKDKRMTRLENLVGQLNEQVREMKKRLEIYEESDH